MSGKERALWCLFDQTPFEEGVAAERVPNKDVFGLLDYPAYFNLMNIPLPENHDGILHALASDDLIRAVDAGVWSITNLGVSGINKENIWDLLLIGARKNA